MPAVFPKFDQDRYQSLVGRATFDVGLSRGTFQDVGKYKIPLTVSSAPRMLRKGNAQAGVVRAAFTDGYLSGNVDPIIDLTGAFAFEVYSYHYRRSGQFRYAISQYAPGFLGGFVFYMSTGGGWIIDMCDGAGFGARTISALGAQPYGVLQHTVLNGSNNGTVGSIYYDGIPTSLVYGGARVPSNVVSQPVRWAQSGNCDMGFLISRAYPFNLSNEDAACLYAAAQNLVNG